jgi:threonine synthase
LKCTYCGKEFASDEVHTVCISCGKVLFPKYDLEKAKEFFSKESVQKRNTYSIWRFHEVMPVKDSIFRLSLGEGWTPIIKLRNFEKYLHLNNIFLKDEGQNPTGTFKSRGLCAAVSKALELGIKEFVMPSAGNAGAALSAYSAQAGVRAHIYVPQETPPLIQKEIEVMGGDLILIPGVITDAGKAAKDATNEFGYFDVSTLKEPYRVEGKKTMGFELAEQFNWTLPDIIIYPTGGGTGIVGMWKAFNELESLGLISEKRPRMVSVQSSGCAPIVKAFKKGEKHAKTWEDPKTFAAGLRIPAAIGDYLILQSIRESNGTAVMVDDDEIKNAMRTLARLEGIMMSPEAAATVIAIEKLKEDGFCDTSDEILLFGTGSGLTTPNEW